MLRCYRSPRLYIYRIGKEILPPEILGIFHVACDDVHGAEVQADFVHVSDGVRDPVDSEVS